MKRAWSVNVSLCVCTCQAGTRNCFCGTHMTTGAVAVQPSCCMCGEPCSRPAMLRASFLLSLFLLGHSCDGDLECYAN